MGIIYKTSQGLKNNIEKYQTYNKKHIIHIQKNYNHKKEKK